jgi:predicted ribosome quality control (RQC) complex YloA/Tae2 family protein
METLVFHYAGTDYEIKYGKNKKGNFALISQAQATDLWFHLHNMPSAHVVLTHSEGKPPKQVLKRCAMICKARSKNVTEKCIYTTISNIQKTEIEGRVHILDNLKLKQI